MSDRHSLLEKVRKANPIPTDQKLPFDASEICPSLADVIARTVGDETPAQHAQPAPGSPVFRRRGWVTAIPATFAIVMLVGGVALVTRSTGGPSGPADQAPSSDTNQQNRVGGESAVGTFTWNTVSDDAVNLPSHGIVATPDGFIGAWTEGWWTSPDGIDWVPGPPPVDATSVRIINTDAGYFLTETSQDSSRVWHSADARAWDLLDLDAVGSPRLTGLDWSTHLGRSVVSGDTELVQWSVDGSVDWISILGIESDPAVLGVIGIDRFWDPEARVLQIGTVDEVDNLDEVLARLAFTVEGSGDSMTIQVTNADTGALVRTVQGAVHGVDTDELLEALAYGGGVSLRVLTVADGSGGFETVSTPWSPLGWRNRLDIVAHDDGFVTYFHDRSQSGAGPVVVWTSDDGRSWTQAGTPAFARGQLVNWVRVLHRDGVFLAEVRSEDSGRFAIWQSRNGIDWTPLTTGPPSEGGVGQLHVADFGWVYAIDAGPVFGLWVSPDGVQWDQLDVAALGVQTEPEGSGTFGVTIAGDTIFIILTEGRGAILVDAAGTPLPEGNGPATRTMWIGTHDR